MHGLSDDLSERAHQRVAWESRLDPFGCPDPWSFEAWGRAPGDQQEAFAALDTARGLGVRPRAGLSGRDAVLLQACLARCQPALEEMLTASDAGLLPSPGPAWLRSPFSARPLDEAGSDHARGRREQHRERLSAHRWWLRADITNFAASLDRAWLVESFVSAGLPRPAARELRGLLERLGLGPRRGLRTCGRAMHLLARLYLDPVLKGLRGYDFLHADLDDFHGYFDHRTQALTALDRLTRLLESRALHLNYQKTFVISASTERIQELRARLDSRFLQHRLAAAASSGTHPWVVRTLATPLYSDAFLYRRPAYDKLLKTPAGQLAFQQRLSDPRLQPGDRVRLLLFRELHA